MPKTLFMTRGKHQHILLTTFFALHQGEKKEKKKDREDGKGKNRQAGLVSGETGDLLSSHLTQGTEMRHLSFVNWLFCIVKVSPEYDPA